MANKNQVAFERSICEPGGILNPQIILPKTHWLS
jgi:hypothetical protein